MKTAIFLTSAALLTALTAATLLSPLSARAQESASASKPIPVKLAKQGENWTLLRGGEPYFVKGAGGTDKLDLLKASGGNSFRTWGADNSAKELDEAQKLGLTVTIGIWLGHPEHGFKYDDPKMVREQFEKVQAIVRQHRNHPALLAWGIGNEMEMSTGGKDPNVWKAVEEIAAMIKKEDPNHPTVTVIAEIGENGDKAKQVGALCPSIDILGINAYGGLGSLPERLKASGWTKPYFVTEFGPQGPWEVGKSPWGASMEATSTEKKKAYLSNYMHSIEGQKGWCLGSYTFLWGSKMEGTPTWFGLFLPDTKEKLGPVDAMTYAWTGKWPDHTTPEILVFDSSLGMKEIAPGSQQTVSCVAQPGTGAEAITYHYEIRPEKIEDWKPDPGQKPQPALEGVVPKQSPPGKQAFTAPTKPGPYRLYVYVRDGKGAAATANVPFFVKS